MTTHLQPDGSIQIYPTGRKLWPMLLGAILFVATGVLLIVHREARPIVHIYHVVVGTLSILFFGACAVVILLRIVRPSPAVVLSREGITDSASPFGIGFLPWSEVAFLSIYVIEGQRMLGIFPKDPVSIMARLGGAKARYMKANMAMGFAPANVPQVVLSFPVEELADLIQAQYGVEVNRQERRGSAPRVA